MMTRALPVFAACLLIVPACSDDGGGGAADTTGAADTSTGADTVLGADTEAAADSSSATDTAAGDTDSGPSAPNISEVFGHPWTTGEDPQPNPAWRAACASELPYDGENVALPGRPATATSCAADPSRCGANGGQACDAAPAATKWLHRVTLNTDVYPDAVCNDGSPGIIEVRRGSGDGANRWLFWFKGGSSCSSQHLCAKRWCGNQSGSKYTASLMSSDWNGDGRVDRPHCTRGTADSALDPDLTGNPFANVNVVRIWYCSSDTHRGQATGVLPDMDADGDGVDRPLGMHVRGRHIVEATLASLDAGVTSDNGVVTLPSLKDATFVAISGSSAGSAGAMQNLDAMHEHIVANSPNARVRGILDANMPPSSDVLDDFGVYVDAAFDELATPGVPFSQWRQERDVLSWKVGWDKVFDAFVDESCRDHVLATEGDDGMYRCLRPADLLLTRDDDGPVVETPVFVRYDLGDGVVGGAYKACADRTTGADCYDPNHSFLADAATPPADWLTLADSTDHNRATMQALLDQNTSVTGVFSPTCGTHTGFTNSNFTKQVAKHYTGSAFVGDALNFMQALTRWLTTGEEVRVIDASKRSPDSPGARCEGVGG